VSSIGLSTTVSAGEPIRETQSLTKKKDERRDRYKTVDKSKNQVFFEIEVDGNEVVFLENLTAVTGRKKVSLQLVGAQVVKMRSRTLFDLDDVSITVANPRMVVLTSPTNFDPGVVSKVVQIGAQKHRQATAPAGDPRTGEAAEDVGDHKFTKRVIHVWMPQYQNIAIDIVEETCMRVERGGQVGLDRYVLARTLEQEHQDVVAMIKQAVVYVMRDHLLDKIGIEITDSWEKVEGQVEASKPHLLPVFTQLYDSAYDESFTDSEVPFILQQVEHDRRQDVLLSWILRICYVIRTIAYVKQDRLVFEQEVRKKEAGIGAGEENVFEKIFDDTGEMQQARATCSALLNILQEIFSRDKAIEDLWEKWTKTEQSSNVFMKTFVVETALLFCPFSVPPKDMTREQRLKMTNFFDKAQVSPIDPLRVVPEMLYHPDVALRLEALSLGVKLVLDANHELQLAFTRFDTPDLNLQKAFAFQFNDFTTSEWDMDSIYTVDKLLLKVQMMCEGHHDKLQQFIGEDLSIEDADFETLLAALKENADDDDDDLDNDKNEATVGPKNLVEWICNMAKLIMGKMRSDQEWQASMEGREEQYKLLSQLFDTAAEVVQGPNTGNQRLLLEGGMLAQVNDLWVRQRIDEVTFRMLIQDNEDLFPMWMSLLKTMRFCEIAALKFLLSLLEEEYLDSEEADFKEKSVRVVEHKKFTIRQMVQELDPNVVCDKIITHWNLSSEGRAPSTKIANIKDDDDDAPDTSEMMIRPKREIEATQYTLEEQEVHCLEVSFLCWALFEGVKEAKEFSMKVEAETDKRKGHEVVRSVYSPQRWQLAKAKRYDHFMEKVTVMHHSKYLHFLYGRIEVQRGERLQKLFYLVPEPIRKLKAQSLIKDWQVKCKAEVDRSGPEAKLQSFSEAVSDEYIDFVKHQFNLQGSPFPFNSCGEIMKGSRIFINIFTVVITFSVAMVYQGSYSKDHKMGEYSVHYPMKWHVMALTGLGVAHFISCMLLMIFHIIAKTVWKVKVQIEQLKDDSPAEAHTLNGPYGLYKSAVFFIGDQELLVKVLLAAVSLAGLTLDFLIYSIHLLYVCSQEPSLSKVFDALTLTSNQVSCTAALGFCFQYVFLVIGLLIFPEGYGFADMQTGDCASLKDCLLGHLDYGFRSGPVWQTADLNWQQFAFDYIYNLIVILILAAIVSGIIIDAFSSMRADLQAQTDDQTNNCFICSINRSVMERKLVKFDHHVFQEHYMWSYARFLMRLEMAHESDMNGLESYVNDKARVGDFQSWYPIGKALSLETEDDNKYSEKDLRVKDLDELKAVVRQCTDGSDTQIKNVRELKAGMKDTRESLKNMEFALSQLQGDVQRKADQLAAIAAAAATAQAKDLKE